MFQASQWRSCRAGYSRLAFASKDWGQDVASPETQVVYLNYQKVSDIFVTL